MVVLSRDRSNVHDAGDALERPLRIVVGSDNAGHQYKTALKETLKNHKGVSEVLDVGVIDADDSTAYPHLAVDACRKIKTGEVGLHLLLNFDCNADGFTG